MWPTPRRFFESIELAAAGGLQIVVNCAGIVHVGMLDQDDEASWDRVMNVNVKSVFLALKFALPHLERKRAQLYGQRRVDQ